MPTNLSVKRAPDDSESGIRVETIYTKETDGTVSAGVARGIGGPTATNGAASTDKLITRQFTQAVDDSWTISSLSVTSTASQAVASPLSYRKGMLLVNQGQYTVYVGPTNAVTATTGSTRGIPIPADGQLYLALGPTLALWAITASGQTATLTIVEFA